MKKISLFVEKSMEKPTNITTNNINNNGNMAFLNTNYNTAKPLETIKSEDLKNPPIINKIVTNYRKNSLCEYIGDIIVDNYCIKTKSDQSLYSVDVSRTKYAIREQKETTNKKQKKKIFWNYDDNATKTKTMTIKPLVTCIINLIEKKIDNLSKIHMEKKCFDEIKKALSSDEKKDNKLVYDIYEKYYKGELDAKHTDKNFPKIMELREIQYFCNNNETINKICKYITPFFKLEDSNICIESDNDN
jgi:hypothetical protein